MTLTVPGVNDHSDDPHASSMWQEAEDDHPFGPHGILLIRIVFGLIALALAFAPLFVAHQIRVAERELENKPTVSERVVTPPVRHPVEQAQR